MVGFYDGYLRRRALLLMEAPFGQMGRRWISRIANDWPPRLYNTGPAISQRKHLDYARSLLDSGFSAFIDKAPLFKPQGAKSVSTLVRDHDRGDFIFIHIRYKRRRDIPESYRQPRLVYLPPKRCSDGICRSANTVQRDERKTLTGPAAARPDIDQSQYEVGCLPALTDLLQDHSHHTLTESRSYLLQLPSFLLPPGSHDHQ